VDDAAALAERDAATRRAIRGALTYPALLAVVGTLSIALLVGFVLPRFANILQDMGTTLPPSTRMVLALGTGARTAGGPALLSFMAAAVALRAWAGTPAGRLRVHGFLLSLPLVGPVRRAAAAARFSAALGALLSNGVPVAAALRGAGRATGDAEVERRVLQSRESVIRGGGLALSLAAQHAIPESAVRLVHAGEESGQLVSMLQHAARIEAEQAESKTRAAVSAIEPLLIVSLGAGVALIAAALLQAVYSVRPIP
jgi:type II secretory pathway component PulF